MPIEHRLHARCGCASLNGAEESAAESSFAAGGRPFAFAHTPRHFERDRPFLIHHIALDVALEVAQKRVIGTATLDIERVDLDAEAVALDAVGFDLRSVKIGGADTAYTYDGRTLLVPMAHGTGRVTLTVAYAVTPRRGLYFLEPDEHYPQRPRQVWTQCQEEDARHWFPCHDKPHVKMTTEMRVRVPNGWSVLSNGELSGSEKPREGAWSFHWRMDQPHPSYLVTLVAGEFVEIQDAARVETEDGPSREVPLSYLVPRGREEDGARTFARTPQMVKHFSAITGVPYPWNKYAQVVVSDFIFGGMENTTATTMYEYILLDPRAALDVSSDDLIAHELGHQWFGDYVTCRDWSEGWLNEGFATYMEHVWREEHLGRDEYEFGVKVDLDSYLSEAHARYKRPLVCQDYDAPLDLFDRHLYEKGGLVLHMLRVELGTERFWRGVSLYLNRHARGVVETRDLMRALEEVSGRSLGRFFEQWAYKPGHPELEIGVSWDKRVLTVTIKQTQATTDGVPAAFEMPLYLEVFAAGGKKPKHEKVLITQKQESFAIPCPERPAFVIVDPEMRILGELRLKVPNDMLRTQLAEAPTARGRWLAAHALSKSDDPTTITALAATLRREDEFWGTRAEAAAALGRIKARECFDALTQATSVAHPKVRRAVVDALGSFKTAAAFDAIRPLALKDESYLVEAEAARALGRTRQVAAFDTLLDVLDRPSWYDVIRAGAIDGLAALRDDRAVPHLLARVRYGYPSRARRAAILALPKLATDRKARESLEQLLDDSDPILRLDVVRALADLGDAKARPALRERLETDLDPRVRRRIREALRDIGEPRRGVDTLREDFERLEGEQRDLRARLAQLEAQLTPPPPGPVAGELAKTSGKKGRPEARTRPTIAKPAGKTNGPRAVKKKKKR